MTVEWTAPAEEDLQDIFNYLDAVAGEKIARKVTSRISLRTRILEQYPLAGPREELLEERKEEFRYLVEGNYKIMYYLEDDIIYISFVFDCRQDPEALKYKKSER